MKKYIISILVLCLSLANLQAQEDTTQVKEESTAVLAENNFDLEVGKKLFKSNCAACHTVGKGKLTGPDLKNVSERHTIEWMIPFVKNSTAMIESGDPAAVKLFNEFNKTIMTAHPHLMDEDIKNIIAYIDDASIEKVAETSVGGGQVLSDGSVHVITNIENSVIDMPLIRMIFWASVILVSSILISLSLIVVKLMK